MQQPVILRSLRSTRVRSSRPSLETNLQELQLWTALATARTAIGKVESLGTPRRLDPKEKFSTAGFRNRADQVYRRTTGASAGEQQQLIRAIYRQILEREQPAGSTLNNEESRLKNGEITVKEFIRSLVRSEIWRRSFYNPWPNTKVVEFLHKQVLGRPPTSQAEIIAVHGTLSRQGLGAAVDQILNTEEYRTLFGQDTVPYPRYKSAPEQGFTARTFAGAVALQPLQTFQTKRLLFPSFAEQNNAQFVRPKVAIKPFKVYKKSEEGMTAPVLVQAIYRQVLERVPSWGLPEFDPWVSQLGNGEITVRQFVRLLTQSDLYRKLYFDPFPNSKVVEFSLKHFLGRAPSSAAEIAFHHGILSKQGFRAHIDTLIDSDEYTQFFGDDTVPYATLVSERFVTATDQPSNAYRGTRNQASRTFYADRKGTYGALMPT